jgi:MFS family permease
MSTTETSAVASSVREDLRYPWVLVGLLWAVAFLISAGRSTLIAVMPQLRDEFTLSATQLALISSASFWIYAVCAFLFGRLGDRTHRSRLIVGGLAFWGLATGLAPLSTGFVVFIALRGLVAMGEATYFPSGAALISDWHRTGMRRWALSAHQTGVFAGAGIGALCAGLIADRFGWRMPFVIVGSLGIALCTVLVRWLRDPPTARPRANSIGAATPGPFRTILRRPAALYVCVVFALASGASAGLIVWGPTFLHDELGLDLAGSALYGAATINLAGFLFVPIGAFLAERLAMRTPLALFYTLALGLALAGLLLLPLPFAHSATAVGWVLLASSAGKALFDGCIYAAMHEVVPAEARATAVGLMTMVGFCGAGLTPIFVAQASARFGMATAMTSMALLYVFAVALLLSTRTTLRRSVVEIHREEAHTESRR